MPWLEDSLRNGLANPIISFLKENRSVAYSVIGLGASYGIYYAWHQYQTRKYLHQLDNYQKDKDSGGHACTVMIGRSKRHFREMANDLRKINYIAREEEKDIYNWLRLLFRTPDFFALFVYGSKGVGKTTVLHKCLIDMGQPIEDSWWRFLPWSNSKDNHSNDNDIHVLTLYASLQLDNVNHTQQVYDAISLKLLGAVEPLEGLMSQIRENYCATDEQLLLYLHITKLEGQDAFNAFETAIRFIGNHVGVGVLVELSKCWLYPANQSGDILKMQMTPLDDDQSKYFLRTLVAQCRSMPDDDAELQELVSIVRGRPRLIKYVAEGVLEHQIEDRMDHVMHAFRNTHVDASIQQMMYQMAHQVNKNENENENENENQVKLITMTTTEENLQAFQIMAKMRIVEFDVSGNCYIDDPLVYQALLRLNDKVF